MYGSKPGDGGQVSCRSLAVGDSATAEEMPVTEISCRFCRSTSGETVIDLGRQPAGDQFPCAADPGPDAAHRLRMWLCARCHLAQLAEDTTTAEEVRGVEPQALLTQAADAVATMVASGLINRGARVVEFGSPHGGSWLQLLADQGLRLTLPDELADVVVDNIGMMHEPDQAAGLANRVARLAPDGVLLMQFHSLAAILEHDQWNALRHGHFAYYSSPVLIGMLQSAGLTATHAFRFPLYGGTVLLAASRGGDPRAEVAGIAGAELSMGVTSPVAVRRLQHAAESGAERLAHYLREQKAAGRTTFGYGAASRAVALLCIADVGPDLLPAIADVSEAKHGRRMPGSGVPIVSPDELVSSHPDVVVVFVPDLLAEAMSMLPEVEARGGRWVVAAEI